MVFGSITKLQDQVFCLTEERDYFQGKFLEQVSEIAALKEQLGRSRKEIDRLRMELMSRGVEVGDEDGNEDCSLDVARAGLSSPSSSSSPRHSVRTPAVDKKSKSADKKKGQLASSAEEDREKEEEEKDDTSELTIEVDSESEGEDEDECDQDDEKDDEDKAAEEIRQSAEKLLQWASYRSLTRTSASTPEHLSVASPRSASSMQHRLDEGIPSSVRLEAAMSPSSKSKQISEDNDDDDQTFSSTESSSSGTMTAHERDDGNEEAGVRPMSPGKKMLQKFENLVTSL